MSSIVIELQSDALQEDFPIAELLKKAYLIATKLDINDFKIWVRQELDGYGIAEQVPKYRQAYGVLEVFNHSRGMWQPFNIPEIELEQQIRSIQIKEAISEIEKAKQAGMKGMLEMPLSGELALMLEKGAHCPFPVKRRFSSTVLDKICDSVRVVILDWAIGLEKQGVLGKDLIFTNEEKNKVNTTHIHIGSFQGIFGDVNNSQIKQHRGIEANIA